VERVLGVPRRNWKSKIKFDFEDSVVRKGDNTVLCETGRVLCPVTAVMELWLLLSLCVFALERPEEGHRKRLLRRAAAFAQNPLVSKYVFLLQQEVSFFKVRFIQSARK
jgi:hypothetical protein